MTAEVMSALIAAVAAVIAALITAYSHEVKAVFSGKLRQNVDLVGRWECTWQVDYPGKCDGIKDVVNVLKVAGDRIVASANTPMYGDYKITGRLSPSYLVTMHYEGQGVRQPLGGVVIMELNATRTKMEGHWYEYTPERSFIGGKTVWTKSPTQ